MTKKQIPKETGEVQRKVLNGTFSPLNSENGTLPFCKPTKKIPINKLFDQQPIFVTVSVTLGETYYIVDPGKMIT